jgi:hypothetical protein
MFVGSSNELGAFESGLTANGNRYCSSLRKYDFTNSGYYRQYSYI